MITRRTALSLIAVPAVAARYTGPKPPKADLPYLVHADNLVPLDVVEAREEKRKDDWNAYVVPGAAATAKTPVPSPFFLFQSERIAPGSIKLFKFTVKAGNREVAFHPKKKESSKPVKLQPPEKLDDNLYRLEVYESLENGEYGLSPDGSNTVFCFAEY
jgi:hypothetical protein